MSGQRRGRPPTYAGRGAIAVEILVSPAIRAYATSITRSLGLRSADVQRLWIAHGLDRLPSHLPTVVPLRQKTVVAIPAAMMRRIRTAMRTHDVSASTVASLALRYGLYDLAAPPSRGSRDRLGPSLRRIAL